MIKSQLYEAPATEVLKLRLVGVIATSNVSTPNSEDENEGVSWGGGY